MGKFNLMYNFLSELGFALKYMSKDDLLDPFFNSFIIDYPEFKDWFKIQENLKENSFYFYDNNEIIGFVKIKIKKEHALKLCSFKLTKESKLHSDSIFKNLISFSKSKQFKYIYATVYPKHGSLIKKMKSHGFKLFKINESKEFLLILHL